MKTLQRILLPAALGAVLGLALHRGLELVMSVSSWLAPLFAIISAFFAVVIQDPRAVFATAKGAVKTSGVRFFNLAALENAAYAIVITTFIVTNIILWGFILVSSGFPPPISGQVFGVAILLSLMFLVILGMAIAFRRPLITDIFKLDRRDWIEILVWSFPPLHVYLWCKWVCKVSVKILRLMISVPYLKLLKFMTLCLITLVARLGMLVYKSAELKSVAVGGAAGYLVGYMTGNFLWCALSGGVCAYVCKFIVERDVVQSWMNHRQHFRSWQSIEA